MAERAEISDAACPLCGRREFRLLWLKRDARYVRCGNCSLVYQNPRPTPEQLRNLYTKEYYHKPPEEKEFLGYVDYDGSNDDHVTHRLFEPVARMGPGDGRALLDIGCATGNILVLARAHGWNAVGLEISDWSAEQARSKGFTVHSVTLEQSGIVDDSFDVITMFDVLEHVPDPVGTLREVLRVLKPGGQLILQTPNVGGVDVRFVHGIDSIVLQPHAHLVLFTKRTLRMALEQSGFVVRSMSFSPMFGYFGTLFRRSIKFVLFRLNYSVFGLSVRRFFAQPDQADLPAFTFNDDIRAVAGKRGRHFTPAK